MDETCTAPHGIGTIGHATPYHWSCVYIFNLVIPCVKRLPTSIRQAPIYPAILLVMGLPIAPYHRSSTQLSNHIIGQAPTNPAIPLAMRLLIPPRHTIGQAPTYPAIPLVTRVLIPFLPYHWSSTHSSRHTIGQPPTYPSHSIGRASIYPCRTSPKDNILGSSVRYTTCFAAVNYLSRHTIAIISPAPVSSFVFFDLVMSLSIPIHATPLPSLAMRPQNIPGPIPPYHWSRLSSGNSCYYLSRLTIGHASIHIL